MADTTYTCEQCAATIYPEHLAKKQAGKVGGRLLCPMCVQERIREMRESGKAVATTSGVISNSGLIGASSGGGGGVALSPPPAASRAASDHHDEAEKPIALEGGEPGPRGVEKRSFVKSSLAQAERHETFNRGLVDRSIGATRCRTFNAKLTDAALSYMDNQINEWIDAHPDIHVKFGLSTIGMFEAKQHQEPHLIVSLFY